MHDVSRRLSLRLADDALSINTTPINRGVNTNTDIAERAVDFELFDALIARLLAVAPPVDMVERVMQAVSQLPRLRPLSQWKEYDFCLFIGDDQGLLS